ncbi:MAG: prephenate dehydratase [Chloroflexota bacterium]|nr:prephenate dehydratase [Chloroflexota bacterium]
MIKVAFQGDRGAFSEDATIKLFGCDVAFFPCTHLKDVFQAASESKIDFGVIPIENSQAGSINEAYDLLLAYPLNIYAEVILRISHCLMALPGENLAEITTIYSHPQALAQCDEFLSTLNAKVVPAHDTAGSARMIKEKHLRKCAAVASSRAAEIYGLKSLAAKIENNINNYTRFFAISKQKAKQGRKNKTSLVFAARHVPGALYRILGIFANKNINLTKLESRPSKSKPWEYMFYVDLETHINEQACQQATSELQKEATFLKILGSYPQAE